jgi:hypothetical protein
VSADSFGADELSLTAEGDFDRENPENSDRLVGLGGDVGEMIRQGAPLGRLSGGTVVTLTWRLGLIPPLIAPSMHGWPLVCKAYLPP